MFQLYSLISLNKSWSSSDNPQANHQPTGLSRSHTWPNRHGSRHRSRAASLGPGPWTWADRSSRYTCDVFSPGGEISWFSGVIWWWFIHAFRIFPIYETYLLGDDWEPLFQGISGFQCWLHGVLLSLGKSGVSKIGLQAVKLRSWALNILITHSDFMAI